MRTVQAAFRILEEEGINEEDGERRVVTLFFPPERIALEMASRGEALFIYCIMSIMSIMYYILHGGSIALICLTHCRQLDMDQQMKMIQGKLEKATPDLMTWCCCT